MKEYRVKWEIDVDAVTPRDAANEAMMSFCAQISGGAGALPPVFEVTDPDTGKVYVEDLSVEPLLSAKNWRAEVLNGDTILGYDEWVRVNNEEGDNE